MEKVAKELIFTPIIRVIIPKDIPNGYSVDEYACNAVEEKLHNWTKQEIMDALEPYDENYDDYVKHFPKSIV